MGPRALDCHRLAGVLASSPDGTYGANKSRRFPDFRCRGAKSGALPNTLAPHVLPREYVSIGQTGADGALAAAPLAFDPSAFSALVSMDSNPFRLAPGGTVRRRCRSAGSASVTRGTNI